MKTKTLLLGVLAVAPILAVATPPNARNMLASAEAKAKASHKNVLLIYHASWCGWCHKLDDALADPAISSIVNKAYVITHVDVLESKDKKDLENAGGVDQMTAFGAPKDSGIPFFVILSPDGKMIGNSVDPGTKKNIGYPAEPSEIDWFMKLVGKSTPTLSDPDRQSLEVFFRKAGEKLH